MEETRFSTVNYNVQVARIRFAADMALKACLEALHAALKTGKLPTPQVIHERPTGNGREFFISAAPELFDSIHHRLSEWCLHHHKKEPALDTHFATVTLTGRGLVNSDTLFEVGRVLAENGVETDGLITTPLSFTFIVPQAQVQAAAKILHDQFV